MESKINTVRSFLFTKQALWLFVLLLLSLYLLNTYRWEGENSKGIITSDGLGYYAYLPAIFINKDITKLEENKTYTNRHNNRHFIKYTAGTALLMSPFFAIGCTFEYLFHYTSYGFSPPSHILISIAALFYALLGLFAILKLLELYTVSFRNSIGIIMLLFFGTNLLYYTVIFGSASHVYAFSMIALFMYCCKRFFITGNIKPLYLSALLLGIITLVRPTDFVIVLLAPFLSGSWNECKKTMRYIFLENKKIALVSSSIFLAVISLQCILWYLQTGSFFVRAYSDEGFYFLNPQFLNVLFSFRKGLFIYTPVLLLALVGLYSVFKTNRFLFWGLITTLFTATYIISCWWIWYYGDSFGHRAFIDFYGIAALPLAFLFEKTKTTLRYIFIWIIAGGLVCINLIQTYQFHFTILHPFSMDSGKYKHVFLQCGKEYQGILGGNRDMEPYGMKPKQLIYSSNNDFETEYPRWGGATVKNSAGNHFCSYDGNEWGAAFTVEKDSLFYNSRKLFVTASLKRLELDTNSSSNALFVISVQNAKNEVTYYYTFPINDYPDNNVNVWRKYDYSFEIPGMKSPEDKIAIYVWNTMKQRFIIDEFYLEFYRIY